MFFPFRKWNLSFSASSFALFIHLLFIHCSVHSYAVQLPHKFCYSSPSLVISSCINEPNVDSNKKSSRCQLQKFQQTPQLMLQETWVGGVLLAVLRSERVQGMVFHDYNCPEDSSHYSEADIPSSKFCRQQMRVVKGLSESVAPADVVSRFLKRPW